MASLLPEDLQVVLILRKFIGVSLFGIELHWWLNLDNLQFLPWLRCLFMFNLDNRWLFRQFVLIRVVRMKRLFPVRILNVAAELIWSVGLCSICLCKLIWSIQEYLMSLRRCVLSWFNCIVESALLIIFSCLVWLIETESTTLLACFLSPIRWVFIMISYLVLWWVSVHFWSISACWSGLTWFFYGYFFPFFLYISLSLTYVIRQSCSAQIFSKFGIAGRFIDSLCLVTAPFISTISFHNGTFLIIIWWFSVGQYHLLTTINLSRQSLIFLDEIFSMNNSIAILSARVDLFRKWNICRSTYRRRSSYPTCIQWLSWSLVFTSFFNRLQYTLTLVQIHFLLRFCICNLLLFINEVAIIRKDERFCWCFWERFSWLLCHTWWLFGSVGFLVESVILKPTLYFSWFLIARAFIVAWTSCRI